jgi:choline-glycine betaine transporter
MVEFNEAQVKTMLERSRIGTKLKRWIAVSDNKLFGVRMNWITFMSATIITWAFAIYCAVNPAQAVSDFNAGKSWVSANFTWLYIGTQDVWCLFLIYLFFSRFGTIKLGKDDEVPKYNDFAWFTMLFTCGVAVGLYVFGVSEPLYFYRQPTVWHTWAYDYLGTKTGVENDSMRAMQAIFMTVYHWGIHGWVPYILLALVLGVVSFRWGMPPTIRSCFYPLFGDHALGLFGDLIDSLSVATTTFGVCTSLGLGVSQLSTGFCYVYKMHCVEKDNCVAAGGVWRISEPGANSCFASSTDLTPVAYEPCIPGGCPWTADPSSSYVGIIICITLAATVSVLTGLDRGIKWLAGLAFTCGMIVMLTIFFSDNTWYLLNVFVQSTGYYLQHLMQVGFDCEAFQQLNFELSPGSNQYWGQQGSTSMASVLARAHSKTPLSGPDCGMKVNPCTSGAINSLLLNSAVGISYLASTTFSDTSMSYAESLAAKMKKVYGNGFKAVPCGSVPEGGVADAATSHMTGVPIGNLLCPATLQQSLQTTCSQIWSAPLPRCPETTFKDTGDWGTCSAYWNSCSWTAANLGDSNANFFNWWTIFYWAWWITWAPFVGFFVALISRGRTVREVILGGFVAPTLFALMWFSVFGGLAIKMERTAEIALNIKPDWQHGQVTCAEHYSGMSPITPEAKRLQEQGYYLLSCLPRDHQMYKLMEPYGNCVQFIHFFLFFGLIIYFLTSSDSGSMTDDIITASGLAPTQIPVWQKVFWCFTEGIVALGLVGAGPALKSLQHVSIIIGLPYTFFLCMLVPSLYRSLKKEAGDSDIVESKKFNTQLLDIFELFVPKSGSPFPPGKHLQCIVMSTFAPFVPLTAIFKKAYPESPMTGLGFGVVGQGLWCAWLTLQFVQIGAKGVYAISWVFFIFFISIVIFARVEMRRIYKIWGSWMDDLFAALFLYPWVLAQCMMAAENDNEGAQTYFQSTDEMIADLAAAADSDAKMESIKITETKAA